jgi:hypothetical protein
MPQRFPAGLSRDFLVRGRRGVSRAGKGSHHNPPHPDAPTLASLAGCGKNRAPAQNERARQNRLFDINHLQEVRRPK